VSLELRSSIFDSPINKSYWHVARRDFLGFGGYVYDDVVSVIYDDVVLYVFPTFSRMYRYFNYILHTGSGWYGDIKKADVILRLHEIDFDLIEKISPKGNIVNKSDKTISWQFVDIEPSKDDDIYIQYYVPKERRKYNRYQKAKSRKFEKKKK
jgi:hypothetical protein